jgi:hypothetical protein
MSIDLIREPNAQSWFDLYCKSVNGESYPWDGAGGVAELNDIGNVESASKIKGSYLTYNAGTAKWEVSTQGITVFNSAGDHSLTINPTPSINQLVSTNNELEVTNSINSAQVLTVAGAGSGTAGLSLLEANNSRELNLTSSDTKPNLTFDSGVTDFQISSSAQPLWTYVPSGLLSSALGNYETLVSPNSQDIPNVKYIEQKFAPIAGSGNYVTFATTATGPGSTIIHSVITSPNTMYTFDGYIISLQKTGTLANRGTNWYFTHTYTNENGTLTANASPIQAIQNHGPSGFSINITINGTTLEFNYSPPNSETYNIKIIYQLMTVDTT